MPKMIRLKIKNDIYTETNIKKAINVYKHLVDIEVECHENGYMILCFNNCMYDEKLTVKEFENYLIGMENL